MTTNDEGLALTIPVEMIRRVGHGNLTWLAVYAALVIEQEHGVQHAGHRWVVVPAPALAERYALGVWQVRRALDALVELGLLVEGYAPYTPPPGKRGARPPRAFRLATAEDRAAA
jgi:hypothetical protein